MKQTYQITNAQQTDIFVENNILEGLDQILALYDQTAYFILCDNTTEKLFLPRVLDAIKKLKKPVTVHVLPSGEKSKQFASLQLILEDMYKAGLDRKATVIALGGGVIGDIATTVAGLYYRGVDCIQIPTTLLSQVDSSLGGKGAVDLGTHKNTIGIIRQPRAVIIDPTITKSLPKEQLTSGMGEIVKYAIAMDKELFDKLETANELDDETLAFIINRCIKLKMDIVTKDPDDIIGIRAVLNFGHTLGQTIELLTNQTHGEAIAIGMHFALNLSVKIGLLSEGTKERALGILKKYDLPITIDNQNTDDIISQMKKDKKTINGSFRFVLLEDIGKAKTNQEVSETLVQETLKEIH